MKPLNLTQAFKLYSILGKYVPDATKNIDFDAVSAMIIAIDSGDSRDDYLHSLLMISGYKENMLVRFSTQKVLQLFVQGLRTNRLLELREFVRAVGV